MNCTICLTNYDNYIECNRCHNNICLICYNKITKCPYCRLSYDTPTTKPTAEEAMRKINHSFETINELLARVENSFRLIRYMNGIKYE